jgi:spore coat protein U-like protein
MTKKMLILGVVLALVAGMIIPAAVIAAPANTTDVTGSITEATISITAPPPINLGMLHWGNNTGNSTGSVNVTAYSWDPTNVPYRVTAVDEKSPNKGFMVDGSTPLASGELQISPNNSSWNDADTQIEWTGTGAGTHNVPFYVNQVIDEYENAGNYSITITFTAEITV